MPVADHVLVPAKPPIFPRAATGQKDPEFRRKPSSFRFRGIRLRVDLLEHPERRWGAILSPDESFHIGVQCTLHNFSMSRHFFTQRKSLPSRPQPSLRSCAAGLPPEHYLVHLLSLDRASHTSRRAWTLQLWLLRHLRLARRMPQKSERSAQFQRSRKRTQSRGSSLYPLVIG